MDNNNKTFFQFQSITLHFNHDGSSSSSMSRYRYLIMIIISQCSRQKACEKSIISFKIVYIDLFIEIDKNEFPGFEISMKYVLIKIKNIIMEGIYA